MEEKLVRFLKGETVLCAALALAAISMAFVPPDMEYTGYIDFRTHAILFCLMAVMAGLQECGVFQYIAQALLGRVGRAWQLVLILVLLCFFSSMLITNDVALITFVPFTLIVLGMIGPEVKERLLIPVVVLQTIAANLGSMLTPTGNPQNLYLYGRAGLSLGAFVLLMLPYASVAFLAILVWCLVQSRACHGTVRVSFAERARLSGNRVHLAVYAALFALDLLVVARILPYLRRSPHCDGCRPAVDRPGHFPPRGLQPAADLRGIFYFHRQPRETPGVFTTAAKDRVGPRDPGLRCREPGHQQCPGGAPAVRVHGGSARPDHWRQPRRAWDADCIHGQFDLLQAHRTGGEPGERGIFPIFYGGKHLLFNDPPGICVFSGSGTEK